MTLRRVLPGVFTAGSLLVAATTGLVVSYAGVPIDTGRNLAPSDAIKALADDRPIPLGGREEEEEEEERIEELENESEKGQFAERAERAREESEKEAERQKGSSLIEDRAVPPVIRAHLEVIDTRDATSGVVADPCAHSIALPPAERTIELRMTKRGVSGADGETRTLREAASQKACDSHDGFVVDRQRAPARITLCPSSCVWARAAVDGLHADVLVSGL